MGAVQFLSFSIGSGGFYGQEGGPSWGTFHGGLRKMSDPLLLNGVVYRCPLHQVMEGCSQVQLHSCWCSACCVRPFLREGCWGCDCGIGFGCFSLRFYQSRLTCCCRGVHAKIFMS